MSNRQPEGLTRGFNTARNPSLGLRAVENLRRRGDYTLTG